ncbi:ATP-dependent DNA helicase PIF1-like protein [Tanacetum coccineum]
MTTDIQGTRDATTNEQLKKNKVQLDNEYVVPYNATLLKQYQAHINVEWCNQSGAVKYLFKYINKGPDRISAGIYVNDGSNGDDVVDKNVDEVKAYLDCRYVSACEAAWRILAFDIHHRTPSVERLSFHMPGQQQVVYQDAANLDDVLQKPSVGASMFTAWMEINKTDTKARELTYADFPTKYVFKQDERKWYPRKQRFAIGRIHYVPERIGECYYLRMLLNHVKGATGWKSFKEWDNVTYKTFKEACMARGLLDNDNEYIRGIKDAIAWGSAHRTLVPAIRSRGDIVLNVASSGIASLLMSGGRTVHSRFVIPINCNESSICSISPNSDLGALLKQTKLIIWDEATMIHRHAFEVLDKTLRDVLRLNNPANSKLQFGGMTVVFGGDFRQILPVITKVSRQDVINASINRSYIFDNCIVLKLTTNMRLKSGGTPAEVLETKEFVEWILKLGNGTLSEPNDGEAIVDISEEICIKEAADPIQAIVDFTSSRIRFSMHYQVPWSNEHPSVGEQRVECDHWRTENQYGDQLLRRPFLKEITGVDSSYRDCATTSELHQTLVEQIRIILQESTEELARECQKPKRAKDAAYHKEKMLLCKQEEDGFHLNAKQADWRDDTNDEPENQELKEHYMYMAQIQEVTPDVADNSGPIFDAEPLQKVQNDDDNYNVFANDREHPEQPESVNDTYLDEEGDTNIITDSLDMSNNGGKADHDKDEDLARERDLLVSLIEKLKCEIDESKDRNKLLESSNRTLIDKLKIESTAKTEGTRTNREQAEGRERAESTAEDIEHEEDGKDKNTTREESSLRKCNLLFRSFLDYKVCIKSSHNCKGKDLAKQLEESTEPGKMQHPVDGRAWNNFDTKYSDYAKEPRNVRLGLAADVMNEKEFFNADVVNNSGPKSPGKDIDVYHEMVEDNLNRDHMEEGIHGKVLSREVSHEDRNERRTTQNSGICSPGGKDGEMYYGQLQEILEFLYLSFKVVLFRVKWFDASNEGRKVKHLVLRNNMTQILTKEEDHDVIHFDNSSDLPLSTSLNDLDNATLHIDGQSTEVDAPPDIIDLDEDDDIIDDEDALPHDLADSDDEDLVNVDDDDGVDVTLFDLQAAHGFLRLDRDHRRHHLHLQKHYNTNKALSRPSNWKADHNHRIYNWLIRRARPEEITAAEWDKHASDTQEYPSLIDTFWRTHELLIVGPTSSLGIIAGERIPHEASPASIPQRHVAGETYPQRHVAGESPDMSPGKQAIVVVRFEQVILKSKDENEDSLFCDHGFRFIV